MIGVLRRFRTAVSCRGRSLGLGACVLLAGLIVAGSPAEANPRYAALVIDANTGQTLFSRYADEHRYPASITKVMTLYVLFEELDAGRLRLDTPLKVSQHAANQVPSKVGVKPGQTISVKDAIGVLVTKSANDVAVVVAENISGSVSAFAQRMTRTARSLGMSRTTFKNPHGLPNSEQKTTARDLATMALAMRDRFPHYYGYFTLKSYTYRGTRYRNHNKLVGSFPGVDGLKTGYIRASGFNLAATLKRDGKHLVAVVMGGRTGASRDAHMREILTAALPKASSASKLLVANPPLPTSRPMSPAAYAASTILVPSMTVPATLVTAYAGNPRPAAHAAPYAVAEESQDDDVVEVGSTDDVSSDDGQAEGTSAEGTPGDGVATGKPMRAGDYVIQVGAFPTEELARDALTRAQFQAADVLDGAEPFTETTESNGSTLWRARFAGFEQSAASAACAELKRQSFGCFPARN